MLNLSPCLTGQVVMVTLRFESGCPGIERKILMDISQAQQAYLRIKHSPKNVTLPAWYSSYETRQDKGKVAVIFRLCYKVTVITALTSKLNLSKKTWSCVLDFIAGGHWGRTAMTSAQERWPHRFINTIVGKTAPFAKRDRNLGQIYGKNEGVLVGKWRT